MSRIFCKISSHERRRSATNSCVQLLILFLGWLQCSLISRPLWFRFNLYY